nr:hypothetical protein [Sinorhizobium americanum]
MGKSSCGKSTFLRCINFLERPTGGKIALPCAPRRERARPPSASRP